jgi:hypothetical protein
MGAALILVAIIGAGVALAIRTGRALQRCSEHYPVATRSHVRRQGEEW